MAGIITPELHPSYDRPPVIETVLGVQFERIPALKNAHLGAFWKTLDTNEWPQITDVPPLLPQFEKFTESSRWAQFQLQLTDDPSSRLQIKNKDGNRMIQVQNGRLHFNWIKIPAEIYPRHEVVQAGFTGILEKFSRFLAEEKIGEFFPNQWEVTYINQIQQGTVWKTPSEWGFFQPLESMPTIDGLIEAESFGGEWHFVIPANRGRLHVVWQHGKGISVGENDVKTDEIRLTFTARGAIVDGLAGIPKGLDLGRSTIVRSFCGLMNDAANRYWGLKR